MTTARNPSRHRPDPFPLKEREGLVSPHAIPGQIVLFAISLAGSVDPGDRNPPCRGAQLFFFGTGAAKIPQKVWNARGGYYNDVFIDITDVVDKKLAGLDCQVSQGYGGTYARKRIETSDGAFGAAGHCTYAEGFISLNAETHYYLPLTDHALKVARSSGHEIMNLYTYRNPAD